MFEFKTLREHWALALLAFIVMVGISLIYMSLARAEWVPEYGQMPLEWRQWFENAQLTKEAKERFEWTSCCNHADRVKTKFVVDRSKDIEEWWYWLNDKWNKVPGDVIHFEDDPKMPAQLKMEGVLFIYSGLVTCFWPPQVGG